MYERWWTLCWSKRGRGAIFSHCTFQFCYSWNSSQMMEAFYNYDCNDSWKRILKRRQNFKQGPGLYLRSWLKASASRPWKSSSKVPRQIFCHERGADTLKRMQKKRPLDHGIFLEGAKAIFCHATDTDALKRMQMLVTHAGSRQRDTEAQKRMQMLVTHWHGRILFALPKAENPFSGRALGKRCRRSTKYNSSEALKLSDHVEQQLWHQLNIFQSKWGGPAES